MTQLVKVSKRRSPHVSECFEDNDQEFGRDVLVRGTPKCKHFVLFAIFICLFILSLRRVPGTEEVVNKHLLNKHMWAKEH